MQTSLKQKSRFRSTLLILTLFMLAMLATIVYAAPVTVDTFNDGDGSGGAATICDDGTSGCFGGFLSNNSATDIATGVVGGERDLLANHVSGTGRAFVDVNVGSSGRLAYASDPGTVGSGLIVWDGNDDDALNINRTGLGSVDLTDGGLNNGIQLIVFFSDGGFDLTITVMNGLLESEYTLTLASAIPAPGQSFFIPFTDFVAGTNGAVNFTDVGAISFDIAHSSPGVDIELDLFEATSNTDFGDLPDIYNNTLVSDNGARHVVGSLYLGNAVDREADGIESANADGDDTQDLADEDGVVFAPGLNGASNGGGWTNGNVSAGEGGRLDITITGGSGVPQVFIDFGNGIGGLSGTLTEVALLDNSGAALLTPLAAGTHQVYFDIPSGTFAASNQPVAVRVRLSSAGGLAATGSAPDGEVEDYIYGFGPTAVTFSNTNTNTTTPVNTNNAMPLAAVILFGLTGLAIYQFRRQEN